jgi:hypothetical protein
MTKKFFTFPLISLCILLSAAVATAQEATSSADIDPDTIKENIKKRIEQVVREQRTDRPQKKIAFLGTISSITPNSITLETAGGNVEQASTSATTVYVETNTSRTVNQEDVSIGDFVAALGFRDQNTSVLDARRLLVMRNPPVIPKKSSFYGSIKNIDTRRNRIELTSVSQDETKLFLLSAKSLISVANPNGLTNQEITVEELNQGQMAMVIFTPAAASTSASPVDSMLLKPQPTSGEPDIE